MTCNRCGRCCEDLGRSFWTHSEHPLIEAAALRLPDDFYTDIGPCDMLVIHESGRTTCLIQQWLGFTAKPKSCQKYPFDGEKCFGESK